MSQEMVTITVDGKEVQVPKGMLLVEAAKYAGVEIPVFCYHPKLDPAGVCRMCLVEVEGQRKPVTACTFPVSDGTVVNTQSDTVTSLQKGVIEFLLLNHPLDCPVCDKGGECPLQDNTFRHGAATSRSLDPKVRKPKAVDLGNFIVLDQERCILCRRCTRFDNEITQEQHLVIAERAHENVVTTADGDPFNSYFSGNVIELCPVGALTSDLYRFKARPWDLARGSSVCTGCSVGCSTKLDFRFGKLLRVLGGDNPDTDGGWLCDRGRFNYGFVGDEANRVVQPLIRKNGELTPTTWEEALSEIALRIRSAKRDHGGESIGAIGGARLTNEEAYLFQKLARIGFGTPNVDWRTGEQYVASNAEFAGRITDISRATGILLVDILLAERAPVADLRVRKVSEKGRAKIAAVGPAMPRYRAGLTEFKALPDEISSVLDGDAVFEALKGTERLVAIWSGRDPQVGASLVQLLGRFKQAGSEVHLLIPGEQNNAWAADALGVRPDRLPGYKALDEEGRKAVEEVWRAELPQGAGLDTGRMLEEAAAGNLQALYLASANLMGTYPDRALVAKALEAVPFLVVQDLFLTETAKYADVVLPAAGFPAKTGRYTSFDGTVQAVKQVMEPEFETHVDGEIFSGVAQALGLKLFESAQELEWEIQRLTGWTDGALLPAAPGALTVAGRSHVGDMAASRASERGLTLIAVERLFAGGGTARFDAGVSLARPKAEALVHPADAASLGVEDGDALTLENERAAQTFTVRLSESVIPGTVQAAKGLVEAPVNAFGLAGKTQVAALKPVAEEVG